MADTRYDIEDFTDNLLAFLQANLNTKLAAIDTAKNDGITLSQIHSAAYFFQNLSVEIVNQNPFVFYRIDTLGGAENLFSAVDRNFSMQVMVVLSDDGNDTDIMRRVLRYQRALIELFESNYASVSKLGKVKVQGLAPFPIESLANRTEISQVVGVTLEVHIA